MRLIIAGTRSISDCRALYETLVWLRNAKYTYDTLVTGLCPSGPDQVPFMMASFAKPGDETTIVEFLADWDSHGKAAGPIRNRQMAEYADELLLIWDGKSRGSASMRNEMLKLHKPVHEIIVAQEAT